MASSTILVAAGAVSKNTVLVYDSVLVLASGLGEIDAGINRLLLERLRAAAQRRHEEDDLALMGGL